MKNISNCIAYLLSEHDCVIIPGFGGFVVHYETAGYSMPDGIFTSPIYTLGFNPELNHNDGLLVNTLMRIEKTDYKTTQTKVQQYAKNIQSLLNIAGEFILPEIGKLTVSTTGQTEFIPLRSTIANAPMYGFSNFCLAPLSELEPVQTDSNEKNDNVIQISISKKFLKTIACAAAVTLLFLMVSTPIDNTIPAQYAGIISLPDTSSPAPSPKTQKQTPTNNAEQITATTNTLLPETLPETAITKTSVPDSPPSKTYYIIVGSSPRQQLSAGMLPVIQKELTKQAAILAKDGLFRIYIAQFTDKQEAETCLANFRTQHPKYKTAWLLSVKTENK
jgi:hypothetical protein